MDHKTERFLQLFNSLEGALKASLHFNNYMSFSKLIYEVSKRDAYIKKNKEILEDIGALRNVLVHEEGNVIIATPTDETLNILVEIVDHYTKPKLVYDLCNEKVMTIKSLQTLKEALSLMEIKGFSKLPVYEDGRCIGLLTGNMIARWLRQHLDDQSRLSDLLNRTLIKTVMDYQTNKDQVRLIPRNINVNEFITLAAHNPSPSGVYILTENGLDSEKPLTIITSYDYPKIYG